MNCYYYYVKVVGRKRRNLQSGHSVTFVQVLSQIDYLEHTSPSPKMDSLSQSSGAGGGALDALRRLEVKVSGELEIL